MVSFSNRRPFETINVIYYFDFILCSDEVMRLIAQTKNKKEKRTLSFIEVCYLMSGIMLVFKAQVTFLYGKFDLF